MRPSKPASSPLDRTSRVMPLRSLERLSTHPATMSTLLNRLRTLSGAAASTSEPSGPDFNPNSRQPPPPPSPSTSAFKRHMHAHPAPSPPPAPRTPKVSWLREEEHERYLASSLGCEGLEELRMTLTAIVLSECAYKRPDPEVLHFASNFPSRFPPELIDLSAVAHSLSHTKQRFVVGEGEGAIYCSCMGTKDSRDFVSDANMRLREVPWLRDSLDVAPASQDEGEPGAPSSSTGLFSSKPRAHAGFLWRSEHLPVEQLYSEAVSKGKKLVLTGHSLGGCVAGLAALRLLHEIQTGKIPAAAKLLQQGKDPLEHVHCVTLAAVPVGNEALAHWVKSNGFDLRLKNLVLREDPIPELYTRVFVSADALLSPTQPDSSPTSSPSVSPSAASFDPLASIEDKDSEGELNALQTRLGALQSQIVRQVQRIGSNIPSLSAPSVARNAWTGLASSLRDVRDQFPSYFPVGRNFIVLEMGLQNLEQWQLTIESLTPEERRAMNDEAIIKVLQSKFGEMILKPSPPSEPLLPPLLSSLPFARAASPTVADPSGSGVNSESDEAAGGAINVRQKLRVRKVHHSMKWYQARVQEILFSAMEAHPALRNAPRSSPPYPVTYQPLAIALGFKLGGAQLFPSEASLSLPEPLTGPGLGFNLAALGRKVRARMQPPSAPSLDPTVPLALSGLSGAPHISSLSARLEPGGLPVPLRLSASSSALSLLDALAPSAAITRAGTYWKGGLGRFLREGPSASSVLLDARIPLHFLQASLQALLLRQAEGAQGPLPTLLLTACSDLHSQTVEVEARPRSAAWVLAPSAPALGPRVAAALSGPDAWSAPSRMAFLSPDLAAIYAPLLPTSEWDALERTWSAAPSSPPRAPLSRGWRLPSWSRLKSRVLALANRATTATDAASSASVLQEESLVPAPLAMDGSAPPAPVPAPAFASPELLLHRPPRTLLIASELEPVTSTGASATCTPVDERARALWLAARQRDPGAKVILVAACPGPILTESESEDQVAAVTLRALERFGASPLDLESGALDLIVLRAARRPSPSLASLTAVASSRLKVLGGHFSNVGRRRGSEVSSARDRLLPRRPAAVAEPPEGTTPNTGTEERAVDGAEFSEADVERLRAAVKLG